MVKAFICSTAGQEFESQPGRFYEQILICLSNVHDVKPEGVLYSVLYAKAI